MPTYTTFTVGQVLTAALMNQVLKLFGGGTAQIGTTPTAATPFLTQAGSLVATTTTTGDVTLTYPTAFPNGVLAVLVCPGDNAASLGETIATVGTLSSTTIRCNTAAGVGINTLQVRVNWIAIGW